jgi:hypothetical protein
MTAYLITFYRPPRTGWEQAGEIKRREDILTTMQNSGDMDGFKNAVLSFGKNQGLVLDSMSAVTQPPKVTALKDELERLVKCFHPRAQDIVAQQTEE